MRPATGNSDEEISYSTCSISILPGPGGTDMEDPITFTCLSCGTELMAPPETLEET